MTTKKSFLIQLKVILRLQIVFMMLRIIKLLNFILKQVYNKEQKFTEKVIYSLQISTIILVRTIINKNNLIKRNLKQSKLYQFIQVFLVTQIKQFQRYNIIQLKYILNCLSLKEHGSFILKLCKDIEKITDYLLPLLIKYSFLNTCNTIKFNSILQVKLVNMNNIKINYQI